MSKKSAPVVEFSSSEGDQNDDDFEEDRKVLQRKAKQGKKRGRQDGDGDDAQTCVCGAQWHSSGLHRICCLKCGHLFGKSCILKWVASNHNCPICKKRAVPADIRPLYTSKFAVQDNSDREAFNAAIAKETALRRQADADLQCVRARYDRLQARFRHLHAVLSRNATVFKVAEAVPACNARSLTFHDASRSVLFTTGGAFHRVSQLDSQHCRKIDAGHAGDIRNLQCCPDLGSLNVLSAGVDKRVRVSSLQSESSILGYEVNQAAWSCAWVSTFVIVAGTASGSMYVFDIRKSRDVLAQIQCRVPAGLQSLCVLPSGDAPDVSLLYAGPGHAGVVSVDAGWSNPNWHDFEFDARRCCSASYDAAADRISLSMRGDDEVAHIVVDRGSGDVVHCVADGYTTSAMLGRSSIFTDESLGSCLVVSGDETSRSPWVWSASTGLTIAKLPSHTSRVLDVAYSRSAAMLATLSDEQLLLFKPALG